MNQENELKYGINLATLEEYNKVTSPGFRFYAEETKRTFFAEDFYPWHWHAAVQFFYVTKGQMQYSVPGKTYTFKEGDAGFLNGRTLHLLEYPDQKECSFLCILFHPQLIGGDAQSDIMRQYVRPITDNADFDIFCMKQTDPGYETVTAAIQSCCDLYSRKEPFYELKIQMELMKLWLTFYQVTEDYRGHLSRKVSSNRIKAMIGYLNDHYMDKVSLEDIARAGLCSKRECSRTFRLQLHTTPFDYLLAIRLQKAMGFLTESDRSVTEIGASCGFSSSSYFIKLFREKYRLSPKEFRKKYAAGEIRPDG